MQKFKFISAFVVSAVMFSSCQQSDNQLKTNIDDLQLYVDSVSNIIPVYTTEKWNTVNEGYTLRMGKLDNLKDKMTEVEKQEFSKAQEKFENLKSDYERKFKEDEQKAAAPDAKQVLRNSLFGEGKIGSDMQFGFVTADNALGVYKNFVNAVDENQNKYSREDWDEIKVLYEALDTRKNEVEKDLASKDNLEIAKLKIKFAAIKTVKRPFSKVKENEDAKQ